MAKITIKDIYDLEIDRCREWMIRKSVMLPNKGSNVYSFGGYANCFNQEKRVWESRLCLWHISYYCQASSIMHYYSYDRKKEEVVTDDTQIYVLFCGKKLVTELEELKQLWNNRVQVFQELDKQ